MPLPNWFLRLSKTKRTLVVIALAASGYFAFSQIHVHFPIREHKMNEFTEHMQTVCVGRFLIDLPAQATIVQWNQKVNDVEITRSEKPAPNFTIFEQDARDYERELRAKPHPTKQTLFKETLRLTPDSFTFVYLRNEKTVNRYLVETWLWRERKQFRLIGRTVSDYYADGIEESRVTVSALQLRDNTSIPTTAGACGDGTFFPGKDFRAEYFGISVRLPGYPGAWMGFGTETYGRPYEEKGLIDRFTRSISMPDVAGRVNFSILRSTSLRVNGQAAEEYVIATSNVESTYPGRDLTAELEVYPLPNTLANPLIKLRGGSDSYDSGTNKPYPRVMEDEVFLSIWDKALKSIRLRPGAV
jgi:hypothetical protein